jgi:hypothetical protein
MQMFSPAVSDTAQSHLWLIVLVLVAPSLSLYTHLTLPTIA